MKSWSNVVLLTTSLGLSALLGEALVRSYFGDQIVLFPRYHEEAAYGEFTIRRLKPPTNAPHGQQHISELSHMLLGIAVVRRIERVAPPHEVADVRDSPPKWPSKVLGRAHAHGDHSALEPLC